MNSEQLNSFIEVYCDHVVEHMSVKEMEQLLYELLVDSFANYSHLEMVDLVRSIYDDEITEDMLSAAGVPGEEAHTLLSTGDSCSL